MLHGASAEHGMLVVVQLVPHATCYPLPRDGTRAYTALPGHLYDEILDAGTGGANNFWARKKLDLNGAGQGVFGLQR